jgi:hypothetical protein
VVVCLRGRLVAYRFPQAFLGDTMMYSSALWPDSTGGVRGDLEAMGPAESDLDNAQLNKLHYLLRKARVRPGDRVLEFGTGWGSMAIEVRLLFPSVAPPAADITFFPLVLGRKDGVYR